ncbi:MAG: CoB--CoM heterodisulfide reductase iron-sulfur subunit A family protein [Desulfovermiculus sp.]
MNTPSTTEQKDLRIGVFICDCGSNIAGHLNCREVTDYASTLPGVVYAKENLYTCSEGGIQEIKKGIQEHNLNRVVVASCSPRTHSPLFSSSCAEAGLNPYLFEMVNIRDQCSWVHMGDQEGATEKAKELVRMGVAKSANLEPQQDIMSDLVSRALVIGGGVAGMSAALSLAEMGLEVVLVEKSAQLGGVVRGLNRIGPSGVPARERIDPLIKDVTHNTNITLYTGAQVKEVGGYIGNYVVTFADSEQQTRQEEVGCIVVATGALPLRPEGKFGYDGRQVITQMELEGLLSQGTLNAKRVVMIQCAGARDEEREYCSRICCLTGVKNARLIKEQNPEAEVHILYRDMQMYGTSREKLLWETRGMGVDFSVYDPASPPEVGKGKVRFYHSLLGREIDYPCDLVVLSTPLVAREDAALISRMMRVPTDQNGFFLEAHAKLRPLDFAADGIFVCGSARYPACVDEARAQGIGVAARVGTILFKDQLVSSAIVAEINAQTCVGCLGCIDVCPYQAISFDPQKGVCQVNDILCKGCGNCAATCPSESAQLRGFKPEQLMAQIRAAA